MAGVILALYLAREVMIPFALALTLNFLLTPAVIFLEKLRLGRVASVMIVLLVSIIAVGGIGWVVGNQLLQVANDLPNYKDNIHQRIEALRGPTGGVIGQASKNVAEITKELASPTTDVPVSPAAPAGRVSRASKTAAIAAGPTQVAVVAAPRSAVESLRDALVPLMRPLGLASVILVFTVFMLLKREDLRNRLLRLAGPGRLNTMTQALDDAGKRISRYLGMQFLVNTIYGASFGFGLYLIGLPNATLWGVIAALFRLVPYIGSMTSAALPFVLSLAVFTTWTPPLLVFLLFFMLELVISNFLEPWLYGAHTGISSLALLVTTVFWTVLWGWAGLILATPLTVCVIVLGRYFPQMSFLYVLLGDEPVLDPHAHFYQRLLAMDQNEARTVAEEFLKDHSLVELYDQVVIPALSLAEQERHKGRLEESRESFLFLSLAELVAELAEHTHDQVPEMYEGRVICLSAQDQADEICASILAQLLEREGFQAIMFPVTSTLGESLASVKLDSADVVCVSALPPFAFASARATCQQVRKRFSRVRMIAGVWSLTGDAEKLRTRFGTVQPEQLATTMAQAIEQVRNWHDSKLVAS
jgi:predicted PurR-regulated permease PerM/methanogenic corrinoid protein MtbC1